MNVYRTPAGMGEAEIIEKKSRFIASVSPVANEAEALGFITKIKKKHYNATHNVFAYSIGLNAETVKASDDGEPSGTAGAPILDILLKEKVRNCTVVVTRYFGGTLLGTGGLIRAYSFAAKEGLKAAGTAEMALCRRCGLTVDYHTYGKLKYELEKQNYRIFDTVFGEAVMLDLIVEEERGDGFLKLVSELCQGCEMLINKEYGFYKIETPPQ